MIHMVKLSGRQLASARTLVGLGQAEVAARANVSIPTLKRMEASEGAVTGMQNNVDSVVRALEAAGVEFIAENGGGAGVRMRKAIDLGLEAAKNPQGRAI
jgi:transcriptional regulator with XRE-family HTH domain